jgi:hypothetical protein
METPTRPWQRRFSDAARRAQEQRQRAAWSRTHSAIRGALEAFQATNPDRRGLDAAREVERAVQRGDRRLGLA